MDLIERVLRGEHPDRAVTLAMRKLTEMSEIDLTNQTLAWLFYEFEDYINQTVLLQQLDAVIAEYGMVDEAKDVKKITFLARAIASADGNVVGVSIKNAC